MKFSPDQIATALRFSEAGKKLGKQFYEIDMKCHALSKTFPFSKAEIMNEVIHLAETTTMDLDQAFEFYKNSIPKRIDK